MENLENTLLKTNSNDGNSEKVSDELLKAIDQSNLPVLTDQDRYSLLRDAIVINKNDVVKTLVSKGHYTSKVDENNKIPLLIEAVLHNNEEAVVLLLSAGANINFLFNGNTPLHIAIKNRSYEIAVLLMNNGASATIIGSLGLTPFHTIFLDNQPEAEEQKNLIELCLRFGSYDIMESSDDHGNTPLHSATLRGSEHLVKVLLAHRANIEATNGKGYTPLCLATKNGHDKIVEFLLENGAQIRAKGFDGKTPLHLAAIKGSQKIVELLLEEGVFVNVKDSLGYTALHYAAGKGFDTIVGLLLRNGASINSRNNKACTALHVAAVRGHSKVVELLLNFKTDVEAEDQRGYTALSIAAEEGHDKVVSVLVNYGAEIESETSDGDNPLILAVRNQHEEVIKLLMDSGADSSVTIWNGNEEDIWCDYEERRGSGKKSQTSSKDGSASEEESYCSDIDNDEQPLLYYVVTKKQVRLVQILLEHGADPNISGTYGNTPLHLATKLGHREMVRILLRHGAKTDLDNADGFNALCCAIIKGKKKIAEILVDHNTEGGENALFIALWEGPGTILEMLLDRGINVNAQDLRQRTPLFLALDRDDPGTLEIILDYGADINATVGVDGKNKKTIVEDFFKEDEYSIYNPTLAEIIVRWVVLMKCKNLFVSEEILLFIARHSEMSKLQDKCELEIAAATSETFDDTAVSVFDILTSNSNQLGSLARNENIAKAFESVYLAAKFPIYAPLIDRQIKKGMLRNDLLKSVKNFFNLLLDKNDEMLPRLPINCTDQIFSYFSNNDLRSLRTCLLP